MGNRGRQKKKKKQKGKKGKAPRAGKGLATLVVFLFLCVLFKRFFILC